MPKTNSRIAENIYFYRTDNPTHNVLKIFNKEGLELSISADDSCGAMRHLGRINAAVFAGHWEQHHGPVMNPEQLLILLAKHLGKVVVDRDAVVVQSGPAPHSGGFLLPHGQIIPASSSVEEIAAALAPRCIR